MVFTRFGVPSFTRVSTGLALITIPEGETVIKLPSMSWKVNSCGVTLIIVTPFLKVDTNYIKDGLLNLINCFLNCDAKNITVKNLETLINNILDCLGIKFKVKAMGSVWVTEKNSVI